VNLRRSGKSLKSREEDREFLNINMLLSSFSMADYSQVLSFSREIKRKRGDRMSEKSLCGSCQNYSRCHRIVFPIELEAYAMLRKAFKECGAKQVSFLNIATNCDNYERWDKR